MAQKNVQLIIGRILTDEEFRSDFLERPLESLGPADLACFSVWSAEDSTRNPVPLRKQVVPV